MMARTQIHLALWLSFAFFLPASTLGRDQRQRIQEIQQLAESLPLRDPKRPLLSEKLAFLLVESAGEAAKGDPTRATSYRRTAASLFERLLKGSSFQAPLQGEKRNTVKLALGKLYFDLNEASKGVRVLSDVIKAQDYPRQFKQAATRLAEHYDKQKDYASAIRYYRLGLTACGDEDLCSYLWYREAWALYKNGSVSSAIHSMRKALWSANGEVQEEALRDLMLFYAEMPKLLPTAISEIENISERTKRPNLLADFSETLFKQGLEPAGTQVLRLAELRHPSLSKETRLLLALFSRRQWNEFRNLLAEVSSLAGHKSQSGENEQARVNLHNLMIQLDGERKTHPEHVTDLADVVRLYLTVFPQSPDRFSFMEGLLAAQGDDKIKLSELNEWFQQGLIKKTDSSFEPMQLQRAEIADRLGNTELALEAIDSIEREASRDRILFRAGLLRKLHRIDEATSAFRALAKARTSPDAISWAAQKSLIDIYETGKHYEKLLEQTGAWLEVRPSNLSTNDAPNWTALVKIHQQAEFQWAISLGNTSEALQIFSRYCQQRTFLPQSCSNAATLARTLHNPTLYLQALAPVSSPIALAKHYEMAGQFGKAADVYSEAWGDRVTIKQLLKLALLYEIEDRKADQMRILRHLRASLSHAALDDFEDLVIESLIDAGLTDRKLLHHEWTLANRARVAAALKRKGEDSPKLNELIRRAGPSADREMWSEIVITSAQKKANLLRSMNFHSQNGDEVFQKRMRGLKSLVQEAAKDLKQADNGTKERIISVLAEAHFDFAKQIRTSPIPKAIGPKARKQILDKLTELASPLESEGNALATEARRLANTTPPVSLSDKREGDIAKAKSRYLAAFTQDPWNRDALDNLREIFASNGQMRLASYFEGRIKLLDSAQEDT